jgi:hypothetical protein
VRGKARGDRDASLDNHPSNGEPFQPEAWRISTRLTGSATIVIGLSPGSILCLGGLGTPKTGFHHRIFENSFPLREWQVGAEGVLAAGPAAWGRTVGRWI